MQLSSYEICATWVIDEWHTEECADFCVDPVEWWVIYRPQRGNGLSVAMFC
jgi:hypothetical protein